ncbi:hypothetical protein ABPG72_018757 [Tetrahymena utriculariae]
MVMLKQRHYLIAFASRYMIKESSRIIFFKPAVIVKDFTYTQSPSLPELINLYVFKVKFKHLGYTWRVVENVIISTYLIFQMEQLEDKEQVIIIPTLISARQFHSILNLVICALSYFYTLNLIFRTIKIAKFIPKLSNQIILELEDLKTNQIRSEKRQNYYSTPSSDLDTNILDLRKQTSKSEKVSKKIPKVHELQQEKRIQSDQKIKHAQFIQHQKSMLPFKNTIKNPINQQTNDDIQFSYSYDLVKQKYKHLVKFYSHNSSFTQQTEMNQDQQNQMDNNIIQIHLFEQTNEQRYQPINFSPQYDNQTKCFKSIKQQNVFLKQQIKKINNTQITPKPNVLTQNNLQVEQHKKRQQRNNFTDARQIKFQNQENTSKTQQTYELNRQSPSNILSFKNESSNLYNQTKNNIILLTNCDDDSVVGIVQKN